MAQTEHTKTRQKPERRQEKGIPYKVRENLASQLKKMGLVLQAEEDGSRCTILNDKGDTIGGPFTHGQSVQGWIDGHRMGTESGLEAGKIEGRKDGFRAAQAETATRKAHIVQTGKTYHAYIMVNGEWLRVEHQKNPAFSFGGAVDAVKEKYGWTEFYIESSVNNPH